MRCLQPRARRRNPGRLGRAGATSLVDRTLPRSRRMSHELATSASSVRRAGARSPLGAGKRLKLRGCMSLECAAEVSEPRLPSANLRTARADRPRSSGTGHHDLAHHTAAFAFDAEQEPGNACRQAITRAESGSGRPPGSIPAGWPLVVPRAACQRVVWVSAGDADDSVHRCGGVDGGAGAAGGRAVRSRAAGASRRTTRAGAVARRPERRLSRCRPPNGSATPAFRAQRGNRRPLRRYARRDIKAGPAIASVAIRLLASGAGSDRGQARLPTCSRSRERRSSSSVASGVSRRLLTPTR